MELNSQLNELEISSIITGLVKKAHCNSDLKEDLFQDLYIHYLELSKKYSSQNNVPFKAYIIKHLNWQMWKIVKNSKNENISVDLETIPSIEEIEETEAESFNVKSICPENLELLKLRHIQGKSYQELSQLTNLSIEGVRKKLKKIGGKIRWENKIKED